MASRAGRHRDTGRWGPPDRPSLLLLDYLESGSFGGHLGRPAGRAHGRAPGRRRGSRRLWRLRYGVRRVAADGRVLAAAVLVSIVAAVLVGTYVPLRSTWASPGHRPPAAPSQAPRQPAPSATSFVPATPEPVPAKTARPRPARRTSPPERQAAMMPAPSTAQATHPAARMSSAAAEKPSVIVRFLINSQGIGGFEGRVEVINNTTRPIAGWQIVVALPEDRIVTVTNASGFVSNGILVLQPAFGAPPVPARGGVLNVFFVAVGPQAIPGACAFNQIPCT